MNWNLLLFLHKYVYADLLQSLMNNITVNLDVFSIECNTLGFKARVKKGNIKRGEEPLSCYHECISKAFYTFFMTNSDAIGRLYYNAKEFGVLDFHLLYDIETMPLFYNIVMLPDNYIQINI